MNKGKLYEYAERNNLFIEREDKEFFDQMKREFPKYDPDIDESPANFGDVHITLPNGRFDLRLEAWFKKWFGESQPTSNLTH